MEVPDRTETLLPALVLIAEKMMEVFCHASLRRLQMAGAPVDGCYYIIVML
jgi:hypothetical protein